MFNLSLLTKEVPFAFFQHFGFQSGAEVDKFADWSDCARSDNGLYYINRYTNAMFSCRVVESYDQAATGCSSPRSRSPSSSATTRP